MHDIETGSLIPVHENAKDILTPSEEPRVSVEAVDEDTFLDMGTFGALARMSRRLKKLEGDRSTNG